MAISVNTVTSTLHNLIAFDTTSRNSNMRMIDVIAAEIPMSCAVIVGEPTNMQIANTHKDICANTTTINGREAYSS